MQPELRTLPELSPPQAYWRGTITALVVALPVGILNQVLVAGGDVDEGSPVVILFWILIMFGGAAGGWAVRRLSPSSSLAWAAGAAATAYGLVQAIGVVRRLIDGDSISWIAYPFLALLMATCGLLGGLYAGRMARRYGDGGGA
jgi:hypothetical protein